MCVHEIGPRKGRNLFLFFFFVSNGNKQKKKIKIVGEWLPLVSHSPLVLQNKIELNKIFFLLYINACI